MNLCKDCVSINLCGNPNVTGCISYTKQDENFLPINCYVCNAIGRIMGNGHRHSQVCPRCNGTGTIDYHSLTNEDFLRMATTEQLARELAFIDGYDDVDFDVLVRKWVEWLKQPHKPIS